MNSDTSFNQKQYNRKSIISSQSTGSSNNEVRGPLTTKSVSKYPFKNFLHSSPSQMIPMPPPANKNSHVSHSSSKHMQPVPGNFRSSVSSHSDIFNKAEEQKLNFGTI